MRVNYITIKDGERHPMCLSLSAIEEIIETFGGLTEMTETLRGDDQLAKLRGINSMLEILMRAGRHYCAEMGIDKIGRASCRERV